jgi:hypothetical protein
MAILNPLKETSEEILNSKHQILNKSKFPNTQKKVLNL